MDEIRAKISEAYPAMKTIEIHRAYTDADRRVFLLCPTVLTRSINCVSWCEEQRIKQFGRCEITDRLNEDMFREQECRLWKSGGGGHVDNYPKWCLQTSEIFGIHIVEPLEEVSKMLTDIGYTEGRGA
jgi:hypothetical protein